MEPPTLQQLLTTASIILLVLIIAYTILNYRTTSKILKQYGVYIRKTMQLEEVKNFISTHRKVKVEVEDRESTIKVYWIDTIEKSHIAVELDRKSSNVVYVGKD
ncbi:MAG: hypothetical protein LRS47_01110 [Desulfurococcales archaeon]|nr:hypothetical protein [Desulfurococcales archaeon]